MTRQSLKPGRGSEPNPLASLVLEQLKASRR